MSLDISMVVPIYRSQDSLEELYKRLTLVLEKMAVSYEIILVNDCSPDNSYAKMKELRAKDKRVNIISLMRNFGQHNALMCGLNHARGNYVITMDDDLQNPPEEIPQLLEKINEGYDVVVGRAIAKKHSWYRNLGSDIIGKIYEKVFNKPQEVKMSSFRILKRSLVLEIIKMKTPNPMLDALILSCTLNIANVDVEHDERKYGRSNYSLIKIYKLSFDILVNYSILPLRIISINGFIFSILGVFIALYVVVSKFMNKISISGWASTIALICLFSGMILMSFGMVGEYLIRIIGEVADHRQYIIKESSYSE